MIVTILESGFEIEHEDGTIETVADLPENFIPYSTRFRGGGSSRDLTVLRKATGRRFQTLEDLQALPSLPEYREMQLTRPKWREFHLDILHRVDKYMRANPAGVSNPCQKGDPLNYLIQEGANAVFEEWERMCHRLGPLLFDYAGIKQYLRKLSTPEERIDFLKAVEHEMWRPCWAFPDNLNEGESDQAPFWYVAMEYRHALNPTDLRRVQEIRIAWEESYPIEVLRQTTSIEPHVGGDEPGNIDAENQPANEAGEQFQRMKWTGGQMDLVFLIDRLKAVGLLAPTTTDAEILAHFDFGGKAEDMAKNYRNIRRKVKQGKAHPDAERYGVLVSLMLDRVQATPVPEDLRHLLTYPDRERKR